MINLPIGGVEAGERSPSHPDPGLSWALVVGAGKVLSAMGWTDLLLVRFPFDFGNPEWEFGTISTFLDGMPLGTLGLALLGAGSLARGWRRITRAVGFACFVVQVFLLLSATLYSLTLPVALCSSPPVLSGPLKEAIGKPAEFSLALMAFYGWFG